MASSIVSQGDHDDKGGGARVFTTLAELTAGMQRLAVAVDEVAPAGVLELVEQLEILHRKLAYVRARALARADKSCLWQVAGSRSFAAWMSTWLGADPGEVRKTVREVAAVEDHLPLLGQAASAGAVSWGHVAAMTRATLGTEKQRAALGHDEVGEAFLVEQATYQPVGQFRRLVNVWANRADPDAGDGRWQQHREDEYVVLAKTLGGYHLQGWLSEVNGKTVAQAIDAAIGIPPEGDSRTLQQRNAQGLTDIANMALSTGRLLPNSVIRPHLLVTVDYPTLRHLLARPGISGDRADSSENINQTSGTRRNGLANPGGATRAGVPDPGFRLKDQPALDDGTILTATQLAYIACDSSVTRIIFGPQSEILDVGRARRTVTNAQRKGVQARDRTCRYPGCGAHSTSSEVHHVQHWANGGVTAIENLILLCRHHHQHIHARNIYIKHQTGKWRFYTPDGVPIHSQKHANRNTQNPDP